MIGINKQCMLIFVLAILLTINATTPNATIPNEAEGSTSGESTGYIDVKPSKESVEEMEEICENKKDGKWKDGECKFPTYDTNSEKEKAAFEDKLAADGLWDSYKEQQQEAEQEKEEKEVKEVIDDINDDEEKEEEEEDEDRDYDEDPYNDSENVEGGD